MGLHFLKSDVTSLNFWNECGTFGDNLADYLIGLNKHSDFMGCLLYKLLFSRLLLMVCFHYKQWNHCVDARRQGPGILASSEAS